MLTNHPPPSVAVAVLDVNTIWRARPFQAMSAMRPIIGVAPTDLPAARRARRFHRDQEFEPSLPHYHRVPVTMLPGWASRMGHIDRRRLWRRACVEADSRGQRIGVVVFTLPHYAPLQVRLPLGVLTVYYASDDYREYQGWDRMAVASAERQMVQKADVSIFVSAALARRAKSECPAQAEKIHVSMNATETAFFSHTGKPPELADLPRPVAGVVGTVDETLDLDLLLSTASLPEVASLAFVGPIRCAEQRLRALRNHPKVRFFGPRPHYELPSWTQSFDLALIAYTATALNHSRSPMRLFDHLASGPPIVALDTCDQLTTFSDVIAVSANGESFRAAVRRALESDSPHMRDIRVHRSRCHTWAQRASALDDLIERAVVARGVGTD